MQFLPLYFNVRRGRIALIGAGEAAQNKLRLLLSAGASVLWYAERADLTPAAAPEAVEGRLEISQVDPLRADLSGIHRGRSREWGSS